MNSLETNAINIGWRRRDSVLESTAVAGVGAVAVSLARRCLIEPEHQWHGLFAGDVLLLQAPLSSLPWADGVYYLGCDPLTPKLLMPVYLTPDKPVMLVERSIRNTVSIDTGLLAILPNKSLVLDLRKVRSLAVSELVEVAEERG